VQKYLDMRHNGPV